MRLKHLNKLFSIDRYKKLSIDFRNPLRALYASSGISKMKQQIITNKGYTIYTDREDLPVWDAYFSAKECRITISNDLFKITPLKKDIPPYFIRGGTQCFTYQPSRWNRAPERAELLNKIEQSEKSIYSQHGEDGVIEYLLQKIPISHRYIVEFGAYDGVGMSNSRHLIKNKGWNSFLIEADNRLYKKLSKLYKGSQTVKTKKSFVTEENINDLFSEANIPYDFEVLSIDIDSIDYYVWRGLNQFRPKIVIVEYNSCIPSNQEYIASKEQAVELGGTSKEGASILSWHKLGIKKGYQLVYGELHGANLFFVDNKYMQSLGDSNINIRDIYQPPQFGILAGGKAENGRGYP